MQLRLAVPGSTRAPTWARRVACAASVALAVPGRAQQPVPAAPDTVVPSQRVVASLGARRALSVDGIVYDSLGGAPLPGATVQLVSPRDLPRSRTVIADSAGRWRIDSVVPGRYIIGFFHQRWDELGIELAPARIDLSDGPPAGTVLLATPSGRWLRSILCPSARDSTGALVGVVRDAEEGGAILDARLLVTWTDFVIARGGMRREEHRIPVATRDGAFVVCDLPANAELLVSADAPRRTGGLVQIVVPASRVARRDLALGDAASNARTTVVDHRGAPPRTVARGAARLTGTVRDPRGGALRGAQVLVHGTDAAARTGDGGAFALGELPAGTWTLEVRAIGFAPLRVAVDLAVTRPATVDVQLTARMTELAPTVVLGGRSRLSMYLAEFEERRRRALAGRFITPADLERLDPYYLTDVLRATPGLHVASSSRGFGATLVGRGGCEPTVFVDNVAVQNGASQLDRLVRPSNVAAIEIYAGPESIPPQFGGSTCGAVVVWTKR